MRRLSHTRIYNRHKNQTNMLTTLITLLAIAIAAVAILVIREYRPIKTIAIHKKREKDLLRDIRQNAGLIRTLTDSEPYGYDLCYDFAEGCHQVYALKDNRDILIKSFPDGDDPGYALRCAEELLDKLNEQP